MKKYFKQYSTSDFAVLLILVAGIVAIDLTDEGMSGKIAHTVLMIAVVVTLLKGFIMMWRESRHDRKRKIKFIQEEVLTALEAGSCLESPGAFKHPCDIRKAQAGEKGGDSRIVLTRSCFILEKELEAGRKKYRPYDE